MEPSRDSGLDDIRDLVLAAAAVQGRQVDVDQILEGLAGAVRAFTRRRAAPPAPSPAAQCRRLQKAVSAFVALEDALYGLERDEAALRRDRRPTVRAWGSPEEFRGWMGRAGALRAGLDTFMEEARHAIAAGGRPRDAAARRLVLDVAWVLSREGLRVTSYPDGLLAACVRAAADQAGLELPEDRWLRRLLRPAVRFVRGGGNLARDEGVSALTGRALDPLPSMVRKVKR